jgi:hypothetical protein
MAYPWILSSHLLTFSTSHFMAATRTPNPVTRNAQLATRNPFKAFLFFHQFQF